MSFVSFLRVSHILSVSSGKLINKLNNQFLQKKMEMVTNSSGFEFSKRGISLLVKLSLLQEGQCQDIGFLTEHNSSAALAMMC